MTKILLIGTLLAAALSTPAQAKPRAPEQASASFVQIEQAVTACFAETIVANPAATAHAMKRRWYEAAGITGFLCRPEVDAMIRARDGLNGPGAGARYFKTTYIRQLGHELAARLQPMLETKALASAEVPVAQASLIDVNVEAVREKSE